MPLTGAKQSTCDVQCQSPTGQLPASLAHLLLLELGTGHAVSPRLPRFFVLLAQVYEPVPHDAQDSLIRQGGPGGLVFPSRDRLEHSTDVSVCHFRPPVLLWCFSNRRVMFNACLSQVSSRPSGHVFAALIALENLKLTSSLPFAPCVDFHDHS